MNLLVQYLITFFCFICIDLLWLGVIARKLYVFYLGDFLRTPPNWPVAFIFYALFIIGLLYYAVSPAIASQDLKKAVFQGALFGFFTYMTYDLTNYATLKNWPGQLVFIDIIWGTILGASVAFFATYIYLKIF